MLHPSYTDLMKVVNQDVEEGESKVVNSRYSIVMATSKRARQLIDGDLPMVHAKAGEKPCLLYTSGKTVPCCKIRCQDLFCLSG